MGDEDLTAGSVVSSGTAFPFERRKPLPVLDCRRPFWRCRGRHLIPSRNLETYLGTESALFPFCLAAGFSDAPVSPGFRNYWKTNNFSSLIEPKMIEALVEKKVQYAKLYRNLLAQLGGCIARVILPRRPTLTEVPEYLVNCHTRWRNPKTPRTLLARDLKTLTPYPGRTTYLNFVWMVMKMRKMSMVQTSASSLRKSHWHDPENFFNNTTFILRFRLV
jgi:hypothetical protein